MKILIAAASFAANISGLQRHAFNMARCLLGAPEIEAVHFVVAPWQQEMILAIVKLLSKFCLSEKLT